MLDHEVKVIKGSDLYPDTGVDVAGSIKSKQEHALGKTREILYCGWTWAFMKR